MPSAVAEPPIPIVCTPSVAPLHSGDLLSMAEFERRWDLHPEIKRAELINGEVYVEMSVSSDHGAGHAIAIGWIVLYAAAHPETQALDNGSVRLSSRDLPQPDITLRRRTGGSTIAADRVVEGPPELVFEVSASSASYDLHKKLPLYERSGVQEYIVWQLYEERIDWFRLVDGKYVAVEPSSEGIVESSVFPGLRLDVPKALAGDLAGVLAALGR